MAALALATAGCSFSYKLGSLFGKDKDDEKPEVTSSVHPTAATTPATPTGGAITDADIGLAKAAATEALTRGGKDVSVPWENLQTGARGTVTPLAAAYTLDGFVCRDFLASYVHGAQESWLQGEACRIHQGKWEVRNLTPLKHS